MCNVVPFSASILLIPIYAASVIKPHERRGGLCGMMMVVCCRGEIKGACMLTARIGRSKE